MGLKGPLPDRILSKIDGTERKKAGLGKTVEEGTLKEFLRLEREDHSDFSNELLRRGLGFEHDDPVRRSSNRKGWPDFRIWGGPPPRPLCVEFKRGNNKLSKEQEEIRRCLQGAGYKYVVAYSLSEAIEALHDFYPRNSL